MIKNSNAYARLDRRYRTSQLRKLTLQQGIKHLEELLSFHRAFHSVGTQQRPQPVALARLLKSLPPH